MERKINILVVEDDTMLCAIFEMFIKELGYEYTATVPNGKLALEKCREQKPDLVLMDIHLNGEIDGIETAKIMEEEMDVPVIYISGDDDVNTVKKAVLRNTYGFLIKPIHKETLQLNIEFCIAKHELLKTLNA